MGVIVTTDRNAGQMTRDTAVRDLRRSEIEIEAASPRDPTLYPRLLDEVVHLVATGVSGEAPALVAAGQVVRGTPWAGFRTGRARLASAAAAYLNWMAPPRPWAYEAAVIIEGRRPLAWRCPEGVLIDLLGAAGQPTRSLVPAARAAVPGSLVVRVLDLTAPTRSVYYEAGGAALPLLGSPWWFEGGAR